ncbi:uncharacterized protein LOC110316898 [Mus pahari]|uniref:uncharacterized protein LOC110316898 n=1 Tax=Mus pahari TaxID=10093 RepID=UPI000A30DE3B|nr:uncharacterized protein LOC110316898 [Mus pahari]
MPPTPGSRWARSPPPPTSSSDPYRQRLRSRPIRELRRARPPVGSASRCRRGRLPLLRAAAAAAVAATASRTACRRHYHSRRRRRRHRHRHSTTGARDVTTPRPPRTPSPAPYRPRGALAPPPALAGRWAFPSSHWEAPRDAAPRDRAPGSASAALRGGEGNWVPRQGCATRSAAPHTHTDTHTPTAERPPGARVAILSEEGADEEGRRLSPPACRRTWTAGSPRSGVAFPKPGVAPPPPWQARYPNPGTAATLGNSSGLVIRAAAAWTPFVQEKLACLSPLAFALGGCGRQ